MILLGGKMRRFTISLILGVAAPALMASGSLAADLYSPATAPTNVAAYADLFAAFKFGTQEYDDHSWQEPQYGGAAHLAWDLNSVLRPGFETPV